MHLLVETALGDSKDYQVLSQEEVDDLKRSVQTLNSRIEQTRQNLALQSKYRDAAINMSRLYTNANRNSTDSDGKKWRSILGHNRAPSAEMREAEQERLASERRCEELAAELWSLEKQLMAPQQRLLKHTAGILQLTHKAPSKSTMNKEPVPNGMPGSPESMSTYHKSKNSLDLISEGDMFDERSQYMNADTWDDGSATPKDVVEVNKGPTQTQLDTIASIETKLENLNFQLRAALLKNDSQRELPPAPPRLEERDALQALQDHLQYLEQNIATIERDQDELVRDKQQSGMAKGNTEQNETIVRGLWDIIQSGEEDARQRKRDRRQTRTLQNLPPDDDESEEEEVGEETYSMPAFSTKVQWLYTQATKLKDQKKVLQRQIKQQRELNSKSDATKDAELAQKAEELERTTSLLSRTEKDADQIREQLSTMMDKLDEARQKEQLRDQARSSDESAAIKNLQEELNQRIQLTARLEEELQDLKDDRTMDEAESRAKIGDAESKATKLAEELAVAIAAKAAFDSSTSERDSQIRNAQAKIQDLQASIAQRDEDFTSITQELQQKEQALAKQSSLIAQKEKEVETHTRSVQASSSKLQELQTSLSKRDVDMASLNQALQQKDEELKRQIQTLQSKEQDIVLNTQTLQSRERDFQQALEKFKKVEQQLEESNIEVARLTTEVTFARAELESAYGSRAERAAEKAIDPTTQKELDDLQEQLGQLQLKNFELTTEVAELRERKPVADEGQVKILKQELSETIEEFEAMTKASIEWEKEREALEVLVDKLRDEREALDNQLSDEKVRWLGMKSPGVEGPNGGTSGGAGGASTSTTVLRNEFRKMMRDTRDANTKVLRVSSLSFLLKCWF